MTVAMSLSKNGSFVKENTMETIMAIIENIPYLISFAAAISAVTKTPKDDEVVKKAQKAYNIGYKVIDVLALNIGRARNK
jgi:hypothetical protein